MMALMEESSPNLRIWVSILSASRMTPSMSMTPILEPPPRPSMEAEVSPLTLRTMDQTKPVRSRAMTANEPPRMATQNQAERRRRGG